MKRKKWSFKEDCNLVRIVKGLPLPIDFHLAERLIREKGFNKNHKQIKIR